MHEPDSTACTTPGGGYTLKRVGEDISEKLDYTPGLFTVERHIRGKWVELTRLPAHKNSQIAELLPHRWQPARP